MSEGIEYAEMLEIPVATINVVQKKRRLRDLKLLAVGKVNNRMEKRKAKEIRSAENRMRDNTFAGTEPSPDLSTEPMTEPTMFPDGQEDGEREEENEEQNGKKRFFAKPKTHPVLIAEFVCACALCALIFLTNVFMSNSAINTYLRSVLGTETSEAVKTYADFTLSSVVSEYASVQTELSENGVLSFTAACSIYPACDGEVAAMSENNGVFTVTVSHSEGFLSVYSGLSELYYGVGETVRSNVPMAYTDGTNTVRVSFYQDGQLLNCYSVDAQNCLSWNN
jgi:hypothetical protein